MFDIVAKTFDVDSIRDYLMTLSADDLSWLAAFNRQHNRLGVAVQLSTLPWLGWIPDDLAGCPPIALDRLADALAIAPDASSGLLTEYGGWQGRTRREHRARVLARLGWRLCTASERKLLDEFRLARALEHDALGVLLQQTWRPDRRLDARRAAAQLSSSSPSSAKNSSGFDGVKAGLGQVCGTSRVIRVDFHGR